MAMIAQTKSDDSPRSLIAGDALGSDRSREGCELACVRRS
jgi:hypothetical protein